MIPIEMLLALKVPIFPSESLHQPLPESENPNSSHVICLFSSVVALPVVIYLGDTY
jgi:hypothetical protein